ncbi:hypothetical protein IV203_009785 [Nitzschia inconspicua]|uniref:Uncharacterized protein n=1 Tax=Nitzschia inconspicua TaxID=303405 RepID=A0A9K3PK91_9STRA|nr:hypothetical protein IV203_009785 [Nitzschia inconspicua]
MQGKKWDSLLWQWTRRATAHGQREGVPEEARQGRKLYLRKEKLHRSDRGYLKNHGLLSYVDAVATFDGKSNEVEEKGEEAAARATHRIADEHNFHC